MRSTESRCEECTRLRVEYQRFERSYALAVQRLTAKNIVPINLKTLVSPVQEYSRLRVAALEARLESEMAGQELKRHRLVHLD